MPRNYQRIKNNPYWLPENLYRRILYTVKDYDRLRDEWQNIIYESPSYDGQPKGNDVSDSTANKVIKRERLWKQLEAIEQAQFVVPEEYRHGVLMHIKYGELFPDCADRKTWFKYQAKYIFNIAILLGEI